MPGAQLVHSRKTYEAIKPPKASRKLKWQLASILDPHSIYPRTDKRVGECCIDKIRTSGNVNVTCSTQELIFLETSHTPPGPWPGWRARHLSDAWNPCVQSMTSMNPIQFKATAAILSPVGCFKNDRSVWRISMEEFDTAKDCGLIQPTFHTFHHQTQTPFRFIDIQQASHTWMVHAQEEFLNPASFVTDSTYHRQKKTRTNVPRNNFIL